MSAPDYFGGPARTRAGRPNMGVSFAPTASSAPASTDPFGQYTDPSSHFLEQIIKNQLGSLSGPQSDPTRDGLMAFLSKQLSGLSSAAPISFDAPGNFNVDNPLLNDFITEGRKRIAELNQAPFSAGEEAALQTRTRNDGLVQRDQSMQRSVERAAARGLGKSSGVLEADQQSIDNSFTSADAKAQNDLMLWIADQVQQRKDKAAGISQSLAGAGEQQAARAQAGAIASGQMRMQGQIAATSANQNRQGQIMGIAGALAEMAAQARGETRARQGDVLSLATLLAQMPVQRLQMAMTALNGTGGGNIDSLFNNVTQLNNAQQNSRDARDTASSQFLNAMAQLAAYYGNRK